VQYAARPPYRRAIEIYGASPEAAPAREALAALGR